MINKLKNTFVGSMRETFEEKKVAEALAQQIKEQGENERLMNEFNKDEEGTIQEITNSLKEELFKVMKEIKTVKLVTKLKFIRRIFEDILEEVAYYETIKMINILKKEWV